MVIAAAVFVIGNDQRRLIPLRPGGDGLVDVVNQLLAERHIVVGMLTLAGEFGFDFTRFGVRVPTVLVSPWIEAGTVFRVPETGRH